MKLLKIISICILILASTLNLSLNQSCKNEWIVKLEDEDKVDKIAYLSGFLNNGKVKPFENIYRFSHPEINTSAKICREDLTNILNNNSDVRNSHLRLSYFINQN